MTPNDWVSRVHLKRCRVYPRSYIGVTGFLHRQEVEAALAAMPQNLDKELMVGVLACAQTLRGETNKWPNRYPRVNEIANIFISNARTLNIIHYNTDDQNTLEIQLARMIRLGGPVLDGFQLNMVWPDPNMLKRAFAERPIRVILQIGVNAYRKVGSNPDQLAQQLDAYKGVVTNILFDPSGGLGRSIDPTTAFAVLHAIRARHPTLGLGIAGGLCAETLHTIKPITQQFPQVSIDAEGRIRKHPDAILDQEKTAAYIRVAAEQFR